MQNDQTLEETTLFLPCFDAQGLIVCITVEHLSRDVVMVGYMNALALSKSFETGIVHYWSRSRQKLWCKGETSGQYQTIVDLRTDCDQDALLLFVKIGGDGHTCHTGRFSCFYRRVIFKNNSSSLVEI